MYNGLQNYCIPRYPATDSALNNTQSPVLFYRENAVPLFSLLYHCDFMETTRQQKIARLLQKELGDIFLKYARRLPGTLITVTGARISPDLSISHVHLSIFPTERAADVLDAIQADKKAVRFELGNRVRHQMRIIPELVFHLDDSLDYVENIDRLLKEGESNK